MVGNLDNHQPLQLINKLTNHINDAKIKKVIISNLNLIRHVFQVLGVSIG